MIAAEGPACRFVFPFGAVCWQHDPAEPGRAEVTSLPAGNARTLAIGFAASAQADDQLAVLGAWLAGKDLPGPVTGEVNRETCLAMLPDLAAKEAAWAMALSSGEPPRIAQACAAGTWVPGQEELMADYRDRYFTEVLPPRSSPESSGQYHG